MNCSICQKEFAASSHRVLMCSKDCRKENKRRISLESYYRKKGQDIPKRPRVYNTDYEKVPKLEQKRRYRVKNKDKIKQRSEKYYKEKKDSVIKNCNLKTNYNITVEDFNKMLEEQKHVCLICKLPETAKTNSRQNTRKLNVDHCHKTGKVRGLLCSNCNRALGMFKDNIQNLNNAIDYLNKNKEQDEIRS